MDKPVLSRTQRAWLLELGLDARMLSQLGAAADEDAGSAAVPDAAPGMHDAAPGPSDTPVAQSDIRAAQPDAPVDMPVVQSPAPAADGSAHDGARIVAIGEVLQRMPLARQAGAAEPATHVRDTRVATLAQLRSHADECTACGLHEVRARAVFGEGVEHAPRWLFVGEAPGEYDDSTGRPFQGRAGTLLQAMLASVGIDADAPAYFTNVLKCRPMGNRSPLAAEVAACLPLLRRQIDLLRPACLVALGRVSAGALLGREDELESLRGTVHSYVAEDGTRIPLIVTHHPASLLLHAQLKAEAWRDLNLLRDLGSRGTPDP